MSSARDIGLSFPPGVYSYSIRPVSDTRSALAVTEFYRELVAGRAVERVDPKAPPLRIESPDHDY